MERDFEKEFIQLKQSETPDLWNRIEAGLSDRKAILSAPAAASENTDFSIGKINWVRWGTLAAACLCAVIIIPAISTVIKNIGSKNFSGGLSEENTADTAADAGADYDSAGNGMSTENYAPAEDFMLGDTAESSAAADEYYEESKEAVEGGVMAGETDGYSQDRTETQNDIYSDMAELKNGQEIEKVTVRILETADSGEETVYRIVVIEPDADDILKRDMELEIVCTSDTEYDTLITDGGKILKNNENYELSLCCEEGKIVVVSAIKSK